MQRIAIGLVALVASASAIRTRTPVEKVVKLLEGLKEQIETDGKAEMKMYNKYSCWCHNLLQSKADSINQAIDDMKTKSEEILMRKATIAACTSEISELKTQIQESQAAQDDATAQRQRENQQYIAETTETKEALAAMEKAIKVLVEGQGGGALLQTSAAAAAASVRSVLQAMPQHVVFPQEKLALLSEVAMDTTGSAYVPASGTIMGMMKDMYETFASNVESMGLQEATANADYETLMKVEIAKLESFTNRKAAKEDEKANAAQDLANFIAIYDDTLEQKKADKALFDKTSNSCKVKHQEWTWRSGNRTAELGGVNEALKILTSDDAREAFAKATNFIQLSRRSSTHSAASEKAYNILKSHARNAHSTRLATLAALVRSKSKGHFREVIQAIEEMLVVLHDEERSDTAQRDQCKKDYEDNQVATEKDNWMINRATSKMDSLTKQIQKIDSDVQATRKKIMEAKSELADRTSQFESEHATYLREKEESEQMIRLLMSAKDALNKFYKDESIAMVQQPEFQKSMTDAPDADFSSKGSRGGESKGISEMMQMLAEDEQQELDESTKEIEQTTQDFLDEKKATEDSIEDMKQAIAEFQDLKARKGETKQFWLDNRTAVDEDLAAVTQFHRSIKGECDWLFGAFDKRHMARNEEIAGLTEAKEFLHGMDASFVQVKRSQ